MRRIFSISLLLVLMLPWVSPLFAASTAEANVPVCCRRDGEHHCMMVAAIVQRSTSDRSKSEPASVQESCPYSPAALAMMNLPFVPDEIHAAVSGGVVSSAARLTHTDVSLHIFIDRSHRKRGPPSLSLSHF